jgi:hypothetical protein
MAAFVSTEFPGSAGQELAASDAAWSKQNGFTANAIIGGDGNWLVSTSNTTYAIYQHSATPPSANYRVVATFTHIGGALAYEIGLTGRAATGADTLYFLLHQRSGNRTRLFKRVAGSQTQLGSEYTGYTLTTGSFELVMDGDQISVKIDGSTVVGPVTDTSITAAGKAGVLTFNSRELGTADRAKIDDWYAEEITAGVTASPGAGSGTFSGAAPTASVSSSGAYEPGAGSAVISGLTPTTTRTTNALAAPAAGAIALTGNAPTIVRTGSFTTEALINNTGTILSAEDVVWSWFPGGRIGSLDAITALDGTGSTEADGTLVIPGLTLGSGMLLVAQQNTGATDDAVYYEAGAVV